MVRLWTCEVLNVPESNPLKHLISAYNYTPRTISVCALILFITFQRKPLANKNWESKVKKTCHMFCKTRFCTNIRNWDGLCLDVFVSS